MGYRPRKWCDKCGREQEANMANVSFSNLYPNDSIDRTDEKKNKMVECKYDLCVSCRTEIQKLVDMINKELDELKIDIDESNNTSKAFVKEDELRTVLNSVNKEFDSLKKEIDETNKNSKSLIKESEMKTALNSVNKEFGGIADEISSLKNMVN